MDCLAILCGLVCARLSGVLAGARATLVLRLSLCLMDSPPFIGSWLYRPLSVLSNESEGHWTIQHSAPQSPHSLPLNFIAVTSSFILFLLILPLSFISPFLCLFPSTHFWSYLSLPIPLTFLKYGTTFVLILQHVLGCLRMCGINNHQRVLIQQNHFGLKINQM